MEEGKENILCDSTRPKGRGGKEERHNLITREKEREKEKHCFRHWINLAKMPFEKNISTKIL